MHEKINGKSIDNKDPMNGIKFKKNAIMAKTIERSLPTICRIRKVKTAVNKLVNVFKRK
tara:strand:- start:264 stop:440 length:177 start_codon:yes stop_codon:yes gene_type:complete